MESEKIDGILGVISRENYDIEAWQTVIRLAQNENIEKVRENVYERMLKAFPSSGKFWKVYIEHEIKSRNFDRVEKLFQRSLMKVLSIDLWKTYLNYVRDTKSSLTTYKEKMAQAYDFALEKMGMDINSYPIWNEYINFLKNVEAAGLYAENQKISAIRKIFQRGIVIPISHIDILWKDYVAFEQSINPIIAEKLVSEKSRDYMTARRVSKEYEVTTRGLNRSLLSVPPSHMAEDSNQVEIWQRYIAFEKSNPLRIEELSQLTKRVMFAYEQCLLCLGHYANIWYEAASYLQDSARTLSEKGDIDGSRVLMEQVPALYERAISTFHEKNLILYLAFADFEEQQMRSQSAHNIYKRFIDQKDCDPTLCFIHYMRFCRRCEGTSAARAVFKKAREDERTSYHIYVAAALMEFFCTKDRKVASNIFELGFKKNKNNAKFVSHYLDYLIHLNDDNNTRVLFERVLSAETLEAKEARSVWMQFLEFESVIGDLSSFKKIEKRIDAIYKNIDDAAKGTQHLMERYKVFDLWPTSRKNVDSVDKSQSEANVEKVNTGKKMSNGNSVDKLDHLKHPDVAQMTPFKPSFRWNDGEHRLPGGTFPIPPLAVDLCNKLPPPTCFEGPFVLVDQLIKKIQTTTLDKDSTLAPKESADGKDLKRKNVEELSDHENDEEIPTNDIYRKRQQKRIR